MIKAGDILNLYNKKIIIDSVEPEKLLEIVSESNPLMVKYKPINNIKIHNIAIHVKTQKEFNIMSNFLKFNWAINFYTVYKTNTCLYLTKQYGSLQFAKSNYYNIISFMDYLLNNNGELTLEEFKSVFEL